jgi:hypothetical protein
VPADASPASFWLDRPERHGIDASYVGNGAGRSGRSSQKLAGLASARDRST